VYGIYKLKKKQLNLFIKLSMYSILLLTEHITIQPSELSRVKKTILSHLQAKVGTCTREHGYIVKILKILPIPQNVNISRTSGMCVIEVKYKAKTLIPQVNSIFEAKVMHLYPEAIFTGVDLGMENILHIIIPQSKDDWKVDSECNTGFIRPLQASISVFQIVKVRIIDTRYVKCQYQCIGELLTNE
jgi:DNA-directed RNA polymerase subunit E'/Rpb7